MKKFDLGRTLATPGALATLESSGQSPAFFLDQHIQGNWGEVGDEDKRANDAALVSGERLLIAELSEILYYAHQQGFIHRDIKPGNILLDAEGKPYLADFGIAISEDEGHSSGTAGTLAYMPPEQLSDGASRIDVRTDIYGLGVVLYELLTGQKPFTGNDPLDLRNAILSAQPTPPRALVASLPVSLERICLKAMAKEPAERYATAKDYRDQTWQSSFGPGVLALRASVTRHLAAPWFRVFLPGVFRTLFTIENFLSGLLVNPCANRPLIGSGYNVAGQTDWVTACRPARQHLRRV